MTHILSEITIRNFKSIRNETFELSTPLVGYNNAGKSNMLEASKWLLRRTVLSDSSFYDITQPVEIEGVIIGITTVILDQLPENQRTAIQPFLENETISIKRIQPQPNVAVAQIRLLVKDPANIGTANEWRANPTGLDQAIQALFPEPIHIGAIENAEEDVSKSKNTTTIGKLLAEIIGPIQTSYSTQVQTTLDGINSSSAPPFQILRIKQKVLNLDHGNNDLYNQNTGSPGSHRGDEARDRPRRPHSPEGEAYLNPYGPVGVPVVRRHSYPKST